MAHAQWSHSHAPHISSRLAPLPPPPPPASSSSSPCRGHHPPSSDAQLPSSPTTTSFYARARPAPPTRAYKSHASARRPSLAPSGPGSSPSSSGPRSASLRAAQENARRARATVRPARALAPGEGEPDGPGGWGADGQWHEWDDDEMARLESEVRRDRKRWEWEMREREERARDEGRLVDPDLLRGDEDEDGDDAMLGEEPPSDVLFDDDDGDDDVHGPLPSPALYPPSTRRLPSLTSAPSSSASAASSTCGDPDSEMDALPRPDPTPRNLAAFSSCLLASPCPACGSAPGALALSEEAGLACAACRWAIPAAVVEPLARAFTFHGCARALSLSLSLSPSLARRRTDSHRVMAARRRGGTRPC
ncbi:hypothetical protein DMC30DRAFT_391615 [Rhodotorula diobovata]|uniref:Uncharacterized protein n=1 Tax=Rhodotorula diobovata TaxID=5288 RepID=A0A5C5G2J5_9BASI|nr:hypothetical protein DMC30DRAFT_391615 [Rhodotorula diobovata]